MSRLRFLSPLFKTPPFRFDRTAIPVSFFATSLLCSFISTRPFVSFSCPLVALSSAVREREEREREPLKRLRENEERKRWKGITKSFVWRIDFRVGRSPSASMLCSSMASRSFHSLIASRLTSLFRFPLQGLADTISWICPSSRNDGRGSFNFISRLPFRTWLLY